jgi:hypothetical protein
MDKDNVKKFDEYAEIWSLNTAILTNRSKFWKQSRFQSDMWFDGKEQFILKNLMRQNTELTFGEMRHWNFDDCKRHYQERALDSNGVILESFKINMNNSTVSQELSAASEECREAFLFRWNNGYAFMDVSERVDLALKRVNEAKSIQVKAALKKMQQAEKAREEVRGILNDGAKQVSSPRAAAVLMNMAASLGLSDYLESDEEDN